MYLFFGIILILIIILALIFGLRNDDDKMNSCFYIAMSIIVVFVVFLTFHGIIIKISEKPQTAEITEYTFTEDKLVFKIDDYDFTVDNDDIVYMVASNKTGLYVEYVPYSKFDKFWFWRLEWVFENPNFRRIKVYYHVDATQKH